MHNGVQDVEFAEKTQYFESIYFGTRKLTYQSALAISYCNFNSLTNISIFGNEIGNPGCKYLSRLSAPKLRKLDLQSCKISSIGLDHLSKASWKHLKHLYLGENYFHSEGIEKISRAVYKLEELSLDSGESNLDLYAISRVISMFNNNDLKCLQIANEIFTMHYGVPIDTMENRIKNKFPNNLFVVVVLV